MGGPPTDTASDGARPHCPSRPTWSFSTSSSIEDDTAELPMLALILTLKPRPTMQGSSSRWRLLAGMMARPRATSARTNSGSMPSRAATNAISSVMIPWRA